MPKEQNFKIRRGTSQEWKEDNPILKKGQIGFDIDTGEIKFGNGVDTW